MPIRSREDAVEVEARIARIFVAPPSDRAAEIRALFVETLDFDPATGHVSLHSTPKHVALPAAAERIAETDGVHVLYVALNPPDTDRVRKTEAAEAARLIADQLGEDLLVLFTNRSASQLHLVHPTFEGARPTLRRMIVERDLPRRTAVQQVSNLYWYRSDTGSIRRALDRAFDVEAVTRDFFAEYKRVFDHAMERVEGFGADDDEQERKKLFVQTLFNRLMFVYFVSRKGWLTFGNDNDYLSALWNDYFSNPDQSNFYSDRLYHLFFFGLNNPQSRDLNFKDRFMASIFGEVPFLNGGLFDRKPEDDLTGLFVPDDCISQVFEELFEKFNFTVMESTPFDIEVAVDPEMLGKVFEELVTGRHETGSYYTPRPVVSFMCREALKGYLEGQDTGLDSEAIAGFVDERKTSGISQIAAPRVAEALENVTVVDPACGSGAYLLGMMQELVDLRTTLFNVGIDPKSLYELKLHIIQRNLYGVDIYEFAANIAMLRLWLSLAVEFEGHSPEPLPNLDFKIVQGDSLLGPDPSSDNYGDLFRHRAHEVAARLADLKAKYMSESTADKNTLREDVESVQSELRNALSDTPAPEGAVDWRVQFAEVFDRGGFDIAIANPPYVRHENIKPLEFKAALAKSYTQGVTGRSDLYCYFYLRALQLLRDAGSHVFVCSNGWLDTRYGVSLQHYLLGHARIIALYESAVERQFSTAAINTIVSLIQKGTGNGPHKTRFVSLRGEFHRATADPLLRREYIVATPDLVSGRFGTGNWGGRYLRAPDVYHKIVEAVSQTNLTLSDFVWGERYLNTGGADGFFILTDVSPKKGGLMNITIRSKEGRVHGSPSFAVERQFLRPGFRSSGSVHLEIKSPDCYVLVIPLETDLDEFRVSEYVAWGESVGFNQRSVPRTQTPWWRPPLQAMSGATLLWPRTHSNSHKCFFNPNRLISLRFFRLHPKTDEHTIPILAILNSSLFAMMKEIHGRRNLGHGALDTGLVDILPLPFVDLRPSVCNRLSTAVKPLLQRPIGTMSSEIEQEDRRHLDEVVLETYNLDSSLVQEVYDSTIEMIGMRESKAKTVA